jgi:2-methylaconitate cis-trans-isomerase PrpF
MLTEITISRRGTMRLFSSKICHGEVVRQAAVLITTAAAIASTFCTSTLATVVEVPANMSTPTSSGVILQVGELLHVEATGLGQLWV